MSAVELTGSYIQSHKSIDLKDIEKSEIIQVTIRLRRKKELPAEAIAGKHLTREIYEQEYAASAEDAAAVEVFTRLNKLKTVKIDLPRRSIIVKGNIGNFEKAFGVELKANNTNDYRLLTGSVQIPGQLSGIITGVFGLDNPPIARPMFQVAKKDGKFVSHAAAPQSFTPNQVAEIYGFPGQVTGAGQCIALIELGGGFRTVDITNYFKSLGIKKPKVKAIAVDTGKNSPSTASGADGEVMLDIEVAGSVAPGAAIAVYFAPNTDQGFLNAITQAIHDTKNKPSVISISWGSAEINWTPQAMDNFNEAFTTAAALGLTICIAAGDSGSSDGETDGKVHVDFPGSSPYALACGGTTLNTSNGQIVSETVWHDSNDSASGGGISSYFPLPGYQANTNTIPLEVDTNFKGRGMPDVAGNADPDTGYKVLVDGQQMVIGGTSAVAPLMAGLTALINQQQNKASGFIHPLLYSTPGLCRDITSGNNKTTSVGTGYVAGPGWDACSGWGVLAKFNL